MSIPGRWLVQIRFTVVPRDASVTIAITGQRSTGVGTCSWVNFTETQSGSSGVGFRPPYSVRTITSVCSGAAFSLRVFDSENTQINDFTSSGRSWRTWSLSVTASTPIAGSGSTQRAAWTFTGVSTDVWSIALTGGNWFITRNGTNVQLIGSNNNFMNFALESTMFVPTDPNAYGPSGYIKKPDGSCMAVFPWMNITPQFSTLAECEGYQVPNGGCGQDSICVRIDQLNELMRIQRALERELN